MRRRAREDSTGRGMAWQGRAWQGMGTVGGEAKRKKREREGKAPGHARRRMCQNIAYLIALSSLPLPPRHIISSKWGRGATNEAEAIVACLVLVLGSLGLLGLS